MFTVDAFPGERFQGSIRLVSLDREDAFDDATVSISGLTANAAGSVITSLNGTGSLSLTTGDIANRAAQLEIL